MGFKLKRILRGVEHVFNGDVFSLGKGKKLRQKYGLRGRQVKKFLGFRGVNSAVNINSGLPSTSYVGTTGFRRYV